MLKKEFNINSNFRLNKKYYTQKELIVFCKNQNSESKEVYAFIIDWLSNKKTISVKTSGSTGHPKAYSVKKSKMICSAIITGKFFNLKEGDKALLCLPVKFIAGKMMVVRAIVLGLDLFIKKPCDNPLNNLKQKFDFAALTAHQLKNSIKNSNKVKCLIVGGSFVSSSLKEKIHNKTSGIYETYGMTETLSHVAVKNLSIGQEEFNALDGIKFRTRNRILEINASYLSKNYIITNDIIELISETKFIWLGRNDFVINTGGIKISPEIVEGKLACFYLENFIICGIPDKELGEKIILVFEKSIPSNYALYFEKLEKYEKPKQIFCLKYFKRINGKIDRKSITNKILKLNNEKNKQILE